MERRQIQSEFRATEKDGKKTIEGKFIVFNSKTELWPQFYEEIAPEAINDISNVTALWNHNMDIVLGNTKNRTLSLDKRPDGLYGIIDINEEDTEAVNAHARVKRGDVPGCSFGFMPTKQQFEDFPDGTTTVRVLELELYEVSPCVFPAYPQTAVSARSIYKDMLKERNKTRANAALEKIRSLKNVKTDDK